ncbi:YdcF family protein [Marinitoga sp. 1138]|uniref:YdcF family protein n=1 Tax=Marinitoga sp. 1138 TaxID=1643334 RepID=UPI00158668EF|nr:YdcF family protein [Marinitoga sp. 1138]NUU96999.1 hypothetical protein [Marinitoga sp. 1138]
MVIIIRKIIQSFIELPGLFVALVILLLLKSKEQKNFKKYVIIVAAIIYLLSIPYSARYITRPLEDLYPPINYEKIDKNIPSIIVILGGGSIQNIPGEEIGELSDQAFKRVFKGYELYKNTKFPIVISGGSLPETDYIPEALVMREYLVRFGVSPSDIFMEPDSMTTKENAIFVKNLIDNMKLEKVYLVTSAIHLPRSYKIFKTYIKDVEIIPVPSNYLVTRGKVTWIDFKPDISALYANALAFHEYLGLIFFSITK